MARLETLRRALSDQRRGHVMFVSHCLLNQNVRYLGGAWRPGVVEDVVALAQQQDAGLVQMPCPEQCAWGGVGKRYTLVAYGAGRRLMTRTIRRAGLPLFELYTRWRYRRLARTVARQIADYRRCGYTVDGIIGVAGSPSCGVMSTLDLHAAIEEIAVRDPATLHTDEFNRQVIEANTKPGQGMFIAALRRHLARHDLQVPITEYDPSVGLTPGHRPDRSGTTRNAMGKPSKSFRLNIASWTVRPSRW